MEMERLRAENSRLLDFVLEKPKEEIVVQPTDLKPLPNTRMVPWRVKQQTLETEDREAARLLKNKSIEAIEKEIGIENA